MGTATAYCLAAALACAAAVLAGAVLPRATDSLLRRKAAAMREAWEANLASYGRVFGAVAPSGARKPGTRDERLLLDWARRQVAQLTAGNLDAEQATKLRSAGIVGEGSQAPGGGARASRLELYSLPATPRMRVALAAIGAIGALLVCLPLAGLAPEALLNGPRAGLPAWRCALAAALGCLAWLVALSMAACDLRARIIPLEESAALTLLAAAFSLAAAGPAGLADGIAAAIVVYASLRALTALYAAATGAVAFGAGDLRTFPALGLMSGLHGSLVGFAAASAVMTAIAVACLARGGDRHSMVPFAPAIAAWCAIGLMAQMGCASA